MMSVGMRSKLVEMVLVRFFLAGEVSIKGIRM